MPPSHNWTARLWTGITSELNFFRIHLIYFTVTPLIFSGIFYASNGEYHIAYIDALFNCFSSMCVCGLATINLSSLTPWQQVILLLQMQIGHPIFVSWFMVLVRRYYFANSTLRGRDEEQSHQPQKQQDRRPWSDRMAALFRPGRRIQISVVADDSSDGSSSERANKRGIIRKLRPDMIRRMDDAPKLVNPSGWVTSGKAPMRNVEMSAAGAGADERAGSAYNPHGHEELKPSSESLESSEPSTLGGEGRRRRRLSDPGISSRPVTPTNPIHRYETITSANDNQRGFPRHQTIEFAPDLQRPRGRPEQPVISEDEPGMPPGDAGYPQSSDLSKLSIFFYRMTVVLIFPGLTGSIRRASLGPHLTIHTQNTIHSTHTHRTHRTDERSAKLRDFGGFPMPHRLISSAVNKVFPKFKRRLTRTVTIPATQSLVSTRAGLHAPPHAHAKAVPYISFNAIVGRNSAFHLLTHEQLEELGGVEYRALNALLWLVAGYFVGLQLICLTIIGPYISTSRWSSAFEVPNLVRPLASGWFALFQVSSAFTNTGSSLVDQSMVPFQQAYVMVVFMILLILGGNCAYPIFWFTTKLVPRNSRLNETLHFLLDHPRRCYTYLFPSHQTWFLLTIVFFLTSIDWFFFMLLDIGNTIIEQIPLNTRFASGLFQAVAVRAAGFAIVPMNNVAPAVKVLYLVMMYISIYPIALSVRSTNVYEEQSLGVFPQDEEDPDEKFESTGPNRISVWSRYLTMHIRRQLAFDMWWLAIAVFLICIIERHQINNPDNNTWFNIFNIMFEVVSAYGTVGLSLGISDQNYSLCGAFTPLSKLVICAVILRGRHRGLPVAIDRAILLPSDLEHTDEDEVPLETSHHTQTSQGVGTSYNPHPSQGADEGSEAHVQRRAARRTGTLSSGSNHEPPTMLEYDELLRLTLLRLAVLMLQDSIDSPVSRWLVELYPRLYGQSEHKIDTHILLLIYDTMMYNTTIYQNDVPFEMDLCNLLQTMKLENPEAISPVRLQGASKHPNFALPNAQDDPMDEVNYHSDGGSEYSSSSSSSNASHTVSKEAATNTTPILVGQSEPCGCSFLQTIRSQLDSYPTTSGEYLDAIFVHREMFSSFPGAHRECARAFTDLAYSIEQRAWRADREADLDAVVAFRHEAWMIASTM
ncbi:hypothetical protein NP233_g3294 [Leucocoprinus birnbaumii]|uniref:Potassium transport protein n=1 Tax=Leucocoprinus birnbaumii TaxID=56174 RepID=A0AAD5VWR4_9AGAR|nr:hypothetical protein NP233_g3294 [Leucocoprinus birnbaumii]